MDKKNIIFFVGGTVIGALAGVFGTRKYFEKKYSAYAEETIESMQEILRNTVVTVDETAKDGSTGTEPILAETREALLRNHEATNYAAIYGKLHPDSSKKDVHKGILSHSQIIPIEEYEKRNGTDVSDPEVADMVARHEANKGRKPRLISARAVHELPDEIDICELQFYTEDEVLADGDTEEQIYDVSRLVGDCLQKYDFVNSDERTIYVMNDELGTCYEVVKIDASYEETHV